MVGGGFGEGKEGGTMGIIGVYATGLEKGSSLAIDSTEHLCYILYMHEATPQYIERSA